MRISRLPACADTDGPARLPIRKHGAPRSPTYSQARGAALAYRLPVASPTELDPFAGLPDADRLRRVPLLVGASEAVPLSGGITNRNYKVTLASGPVVVRVYEHE